MKNLLKNHHSRMSQKRFIGRYLNLLLIFFIGLIGYGIIEITWINSKDFVRDCFNTIGLIQNCKEMEDFTRDYPNTTLNKKDIKLCKDIGLI